jgi:membrane-associated phospholipid phosphatase
LSWWLPRSAVPVFAAFPVAPPRLAGLGIADTVSEQATVQLTGRSTIFYNQLAAVPSLHVGFAVAVGVAVAYALRPRWAKALALLWGPVVSLSVVATGNHYVFDIAAGLVVTALGFLAGRVPVRQFGGTPFRQFHARPRPHRRLAPRTTSSSLARRREAVAAGGSGREIPKAISGSRS